MHHESGWTMKKHILVVDDEAQICSLLQTILTMKGYRISTVGSAVAARFILQSDPPSLIILDQQLEDSDGLTLAVEIWKTLPDIPILLLTGQILDSTVIQELSGKKVSSYLSKTTPLKTLCGEVQRLLGDSAPKT
jgi:DNA-binding NtrC family response regulator